MEDLGKTLGKYVITVILVAFGIIFLIKFLSGNELESQPTYMLVASLVLIAAGIIVAPPVLERFSGNAGKILAGVGLLLVAYLGYSVWYTVDEEIAFQEKKKAIDAKVVQRLKDIRSAEEAYLEYNGKFTDNFDTLVAWVQEPVIPIRFKMGTFHDSIGGGAESAYRELGLILKRDEVDSVALSLGMSPDELREQIGNDQTAYKVIDTLYTSFYAENFAPEVRKSKKLPPVSLDSLPISPSEGKQFLIATGTVEQSGLDKPTILVMDPTPFDREKVKKDTLRFGSLTEPITDGNWK
ncbi:hypothetical protein [Sanyastnella coralliicola]|uniref:hypothetical protein n=1 Tax=Sanyastnella coralliicola TaxID=3069118 RepID=UPI0027BA645E|nr:hypothetical protein [Longitalea sp. SCSIO 12813]